MPSRITLIQKNSRQFKSLKFYSIDSTYLIEILYKNATVTELFQNLNSNLLDLSNFIVFKRFASKYRKIPGLEIKTF